MGRSIAAAVVIKDESLFFLCEADGRVPLKGRHGLGLYYHDTRFLDGYELRVAGCDLNSLVATAADGYRAVLELTAPAIVLDDGTHIASETIGIKLTRLIDRERLALLDVYAFQNFGRESVELPVALSFTAGFTDVFQVRDLVMKPEGRREPSRWQDGVLTYACHGADGVTRNIAIQVVPAPREREPEAARLRVRVDPARSTEVCVSISLHESRDDAPARGANVAPGRSEALEQRLRAEMSTSRASRAGVESDSARLLRVIQRSLRDLRTLDTDLDGQQYVAAGVPWYVALFGRDSLIASIQTLAFDPGRAEATLRLLARYQGTTSDDWRDEHPGKIMHELRVGELANLNQIPQTPYYGTVDATPLFLVLIARHAQWTGSLRLFDELRDNVERALTWIDEYGDPEHSGYTTYEGKSTGGLANQGWKDSGDSIMNGDGSLARPPIALAEVQGYVYAAKHEIGDLFGRAGDEERAQALQAQAADLRDRFNRDFWMEDEGIYALALQHGGAQVRSIASNAGQVLWSGIADDDKARRTATRLLRDDMFNGWGIRTLSSNHTRYNPVGYHIGTVWPHDNSLIAAGLRRCGSDEAADRLFESILDAATFFHMDRLPEVFSGFDRNEYGRPVHYPSACHPQAWAAGSVPYLLVSSLGLEPDGFERHLRVFDPRLPASCTYVELHDVRVGDGRVSLRFERAGKRIDMHVLEARDGVRVTRARRPDALVAR